MALLTFRDRVEQLRRLTAIRIGEYAPEQHDTVLIADVRALADEMDRRLAEAPAPAVLWAQMLAKIIELEAELASLKAENDSFRQPHESTYLHGVADGKAKAEAELDKRTRELEAIRARLAEDDMEGLR